MFATRFFSAFHFLNNFSTRAEGPEEAHAQGTNCTRSWVTSSICLRPDLLLSKQRICLATSACTELITLIEPAAAIRLTFWRISFYCQVWLPDTTTRRFLLGPDNTASDSQGAGSGPALLMISGSECGSLRQCMQGGRGLGVWSKSEPVSEISCGCI